MIRARSCLLTAVVAAMVVVLFPARMDGCSLVVPPPAQVMARQSAIIAEGTAVDGQYHFEITKVWKGSPARQVSLEHLFDPTSLCYSGPSTAGASYLLYIGCDAPAADGELTDDDEDECETESWLVPLTAENLAYLEHPKPVSKREVMKMLRDWTAGKTPTVTVADWVAEARSSGAFDDWTTIDDEEVSLSLGVILELDGLLNHSYRDLEASNCAISALRAKFAPKVLKVLERNALSTSPEDMLEELSISATDQCE